MSDDETLRWYEQRWEADHRRWEEERRNLEERLAEQAEELLSLRRKVAEQERRVNLDEDLEDLRRHWNEERRARKECEGLVLELKAALRPPLGEGFFRELARALELWDEVLIEEARQLEAGELKSWFKAIWSEREGALAQALSGGVPDWRRIRTGLVLEWALLTWLEGMRDG
jgi:hypothetical protein